MGFEEVRYILGIPRGIKSIPFKWWYDLGLSMMENFVGIYFEFGR